MRIAVAADSLDGVARSIPVVLAALGHDVIAHGALADDVSETDPAAVWSACARSAATDVAQGRADQAVVACWTGTGASIAANKVRGVRAALCTDAATAAGARRWNDANVLVMSFKRVTPEAAREIVDAWLGVAEPDPEEAENIARLAEIERDYSRENRRGEA